MQTYEGSKYFKILPHSLLQQMLEIGYQENKVHYNNKN